MMPRHATQALLIVEPNFLDVHVGVRRVIFFYWQALEEAGYEVRLAVPRNGSLFLLAPLSRSVLVAQSHGVAHDVEPCWTSDDPVFRAQPRTERSVSTLDVTDEDVTADDYAVSIISTPWLCAHGIPKGRYTAGIVYDLVPNLVATSALTFNSPVNAFEFAWHHDIGNHFFIDHCDYICCISESTRTDFLRFYNLDDTGQTRTVIPFRLEEGGPVPRPRQDEQAATGGLLARLRHFLSGRDPASQPGRTGRRQVLLVNVLDHRKNFNGVANALKRIKNDLSFDVTVVGAERIPIETVLAFLEDLGRAGLGVRWFYSPGDAQLDKLYQQSDVLVFPSFYEGLGLPILEAQSHGVLAVSSNSSSCSEININDELCAAADDPGAIASAISAALERPNLYHVGDDLRQRLAAMLSKANSLPFIAG